MSLVSPWNHLWSILTSNSAEETAKIIDSLERENSDAFRKISVLGPCRDNWRAGKLSEHDFLHRVKATVDETAGVQIRQEAQYLVSNLIHSQRKAS